ncbi:MAG TPA: DUF4159 domain-containing protein [Pyrinomonadaceae bacterium]|jgi:hypothetical protein
MSRATKTDSRATRRRVLSLVLRAALPAMLVALALVPATGQRPEGFGGEPPFGGRSPFGAPRRRPPGASPEAPARPSDSSRPADPSRLGSGEFAFTRIIYRSPYSYGRRWGGAWATDFPEADDHFITGIREWAGTNLNVAPRPEQVEIMDERLFDYPLVYIVEPGYMELSDEEAARLREYAARGGFLFFDDFWGEPEWQNVREQMKKVFPEYEPKELPLTHPILHSYLDIGEVVQVPNIYNAQRGVTAEKGGTTPSYMGIEDKQGRLVAFFARNSDLGDAWEHINDSRYPVKYGLAAYKVGINVVIYAMSH